MSLKESGEDITNSLIKYLKINKEYVTDIESIEYIFKNWKNDITDNPNKIYLDIKILEASDIMVDYYENGLDNERLYRNLKNFVENLDQNKINCKTDLNIIKKEMEQIDEKEHDEDLEDDLFYNELVSDFIERFLRTDKFQNFIAEFEII